MIEVAPLPGNDELGEDGGAYVWVAAPAAGWEEFAELARVALEERGYAALEASDIREARSASLGEGTAPIVSEAEASGLTVIADTFYSYPEEDEEEDS
jgi:hypothetical protein